VACIYRQELARMNQQLQLEPDTSAATGTSNGGSRDKMAAASKRRHGGGDATARGRRQQQQQQPTMISGSGPGCAKPQESLTHDIVARIYREELAKLAAAAEATGNMDELSVYRRELERLSCSAVTSGSAESWMESRDPLQSTVKLENPTVSPATSVYSESSSDHPQDLRVKKESPPIALSDGTGTGLGPVRRVGSAFTPVQPRALTVATPLQPACFDVTAGVGGAVAERGGVTSGGVGTASSVATPFQPACRDVTAGVGGAAEGVGGVTAEGGGVTAGVGGATSSPGTVANDAASSPLKQMQTIANLLLPKHSQQRPLRAVLPPITQVNIFLYDLYKSHTHTHTHPFNGFFPGQPG